MSRLIITSDIHLGITYLPKVIQFVRNLNNQKPDLVAIAGDIGEGTENIGIVFEEFRKLNVPICVCAGNHDLWNYDKKHPSELMWSQILPSLARTHGVVWLDRENLILDHVAIVGTTAWYDYSAQDPAFKLPDDENWKRKGEVDADAWQIDWPWNDIEFCRMIEPEFRSRLESAQNNPDIRNIVVVTHSPIFEEQMKRKPADRKWGFSNAYYGNLTLGKIVMEFNKVSHAIAGHTHAGMQGIVDPGGRNIKAATLDSQYNEPVYLSIDI